MLNAADDEPTTSGTLLLNKIQSRTATVAVVGLGYVGLTVAARLAECGFAVIGIDTQPERVEQLKRGACPLPSSEPDLHALVAEHVLTGQLRATSDHASVSRADIVLVAVQTPVDERTKAPDLRILRDAIQSVGSYLRRTRLVVVESTVPPGTMREVAIPLLEQASGLTAGSEFLAGCCPERVMPGRLLSNLQTCSRVFGGSTPEAGRVGAALYRMLTRGEVDVTDCLTAELVKTAENAYRDVQIAFANEVALVCESLGADAYEVRHLVNKAPQRQMHMPGAGVGGHCIPKDPWLLVANVPPSSPARLIPAARAVNDSMPLHVARIVEALLAEHGRSLSDARIVVLGYAYLEDSDDTRNSPSATLVDALRAGGAVVAVHDPLVPGQSIDLDEAAGGADCLVGMVAHTCFSSLDLTRLGQRMRTRIFVAGRRAFDGARATRAGFTFWCVGDGRRLRPARVAPPTAELSGRGV